MNNLPKWALWTIGAILVLIVFAATKSNVGIGPEGFHANQGLIK